MRLLYLHKQEMAMPDFPVFENQILLNSIRIYMGTNIKFMTIKGSDLI